MDNIDPTHGREIGFMTPGRLALVAIGAALAACSNPSLSPDVYSRSDALRTFHVRYGEVVEVRPLPIEGEATEPDFVADDLLQLLDVLDYLNGPEHNE